MLCKLHTKPSPIASDIQPANAVTILATFLSVHFSQLCDTRRPTECDITEHIERGETDSKRSPPRGKAGSFRLLFPLPFFLLLPLLLVKNSYLSVALVVVKTHVASQSGESNKFVITTGKLDYSVRVLHTRDQNETKFSS